MLLSGAMIPEPDLQAALDAAYAAFRRYGRPSALDAAPGRNPRRILAGLSARPLAELTSDDIGGYMGWAMTTVGGVNDYKHVLPRILELAILGPGCNHIGGDPHGLARKMAYGGFPDWPHEERSAIIAAFDVAWRQSLASSPSGVAAEDWLLGLIVLGESVEARLAAWLASADLNAGLHLADAVYSEILRRDDAAPSLDRRDSQAVYETYSHWLASPPVRDRLERLILDVGDQDDAWRLEMALDVEMPPYPDIWRG